VNFNLDRSDGYLSDVTAAVMRVIKREQFILGEEVREFERRWADYNDVPFCVGVGNGTDALRIALLALGVGPGDEVISPAFNVAYTAQAVQAIGAKNVFIDVEPDTMLMDIDEMIPLITPRTRAIIPVHLFGQMLDMERLATMANYYQILVVEDAAQAHGAYYHCSSPGRFSDAACFSHYPTKNLGAWGEAGSIITRLPIVADRARLMRDAGRTNRYVHLLPGINSCLDEMQAAVLNAKMQWLEPSNARRRGLAHRYMDLLHGVGDLEFQTIAPRAKHVHHLFVVRTQSREALMAHLNKRSIPALAHYPLPMHRQPFTVADALGQGPFPVAEKCAATCLSLPLWPSMTNDEQDAVVAVVKEFYR
jgi:dTDP-3-amino-3,4,6-trideoxy-alpha-D-glucose transaminase